MKILRQETEEYYKDLEGGISLLVEYIRKEYLQDAIKSDKISVNEITIIFKQKLEEYLNEQS